MTAEIAITLPVVVLVLLAVLATAAAAMTQVRCTDAARAAARAAALGEAVGSVRETALDLVPGAAVEVRREGAWVVVRVERAVVARGWVRDSLVASAEARAWVEPGVSAPGASP